MAPQLTLTLLIIKTIYFNSLQQGIVFSSVRRNFAIIGDSKLAIRETLLSSGRAMSVTSVALSFGFLIYTQSTANNMIGFGTLTALCIVLALLQSEPAPQYWTSTPVCIDGI